MSRKIWLPFALLFILAQLSGFARQNSAVPAQAPDNAARVRAGIQRIEDALPKTLDRGAALYLLAVSHISSMTSFFATHKKSI